MGGGRPLGLAAGAGGVHDHCQLFGAYRYRRWGLTQVIRHKGSQAIGVLALRGSHDDCLDTLFTQQLGHSVEALLVTKHQARPRVLHGIGDVLRLAPAVHGHNDRAYAGDRDENGHPFRVVAHGQCHALPRPDAVGLQCRGNCVRLVHQLVETAAFTLVNEEFLIAVLARHGEGLHQVGGRFHIIATGAVIPGQFIGGARGRELCHYGIEFLF